MPLTNTQLGYFASTVVATRPAAASSHAPRPNHQDPARKYIQLYVHINICISLDDYIYIYVCVKLLVYM